MDARISRNTGPSVLEKARKLCRKIEKLAVSGELSLGQRRVIAAWAAQIEQEISPRSFPDTNSLRKEINVRDLLWEMSTNELRILAEKEHIRGYLKLTKRQLIGCICDKRRQDGQFD